MLNVMWQIHINGYRYDFLLAMVAFLTWFKLFLYFRASLTFGPMFKILQQMLTDLIKFLAIWTMILVMFVCVAMLAFGQQDAFKVMEQIFFYYIEAALGEWELSAYAATNKLGEDLQTVQKIGVYFHICFLLINTVLMVNFIIAILSSTYNKYQSI